VTVKKIINDIGSATFTGIPKTANNYDLIAKSSIFKNLKELENIPMEPITQDSRLEVFAEETPRAWAKMETLRRPVEVFRPRQSSCDSGFTFYRNDNSFDGNGVVLGTGTGVMETMKFATVTAGFGPEKDGLAPRGKSPVEVTGEKIDQLQRAQSLEDADYIKIFDTLTLEEIPTRNALQGTLEPSKGGFNKSSKKISSAQRETPDESSPEIGNWPEVSEYATAMPTPSVRGPHQS
jgi:hypothetical protein